MKVINKDFLYRSQRETFIEKTAREAMAALIAGTVENDQIVIPRPAATAEEAYKFAVEMWKEHERVMATFNDNPPKSE